MESYGKEKREVVGPGEFEKLVREILLSATKDPGAKEVQ